MASRFRTAVVLLAFAATTMAVLTVGLATSLASYYDSLGLSSAPGFAVYSIPFAVAGIAAWIDIRNGGAA